MPSAVWIGGLSRLELLCGLRAQGVQLNTAAEALFADLRFVSRSEPTVVEIVAISVFELGFPSGATYGDITLRALEVGLHECPLELGPHLRLQFPEQADSADGLPLTHGRAPGGSITIASPPIDDSDTTPKGFYLRRVGQELWLRGYWSGPDHVWSPRDLLLFCRGGVG
ncbi:hypothetical protein LBMAG42_16840 [Deltaproteobacteria bacterium]|nr:hypothetical protein LBMAG42_16840 [Deltaproteobacteria bacterium]